MAIYGDFFPVAAEGGPGQTDGTSWFSDFSVDVDFGATGVDVSLFTSAISEFLAFKGSSSFFCGIESFTPVGSANSVSVGNLAVVGLPPIQKFTFVFGAVIFPEPNSQLVGVPSAMATMSVLLQ